MTTENFNYDLESMKQAVNSKKVSIPASAIGTFEGFDAWLYNSDNVKDAFETECNAWGFDFTPLANGNGYKDETTAIMYAMFSNGWNATKQY